MNMKIQGDNGLVQPNQVKRTLKSDEVAQSRQGEDKVSFSSVLQQATKSGGVTSPPVSAPIEGLYAPILENVAASDGVVAGTGSTDVQRSARVAELKQQIADGSYQPDLQKVAGSLVRFLAQERNV